MIDPEAIPSPKMEIEISPIRESDLVELRRNPPEKNDLINLEVEIRRTPDGALIHKVPEFLQILTNMITWGNEKGWDDESLTDFETMRRKIRVMLRDPLKYIKQ